MEHFLKINLVLILEIMYYLEIKLGQQFLIKKDQRES